MILPLQQGVFLNAYYIILHLVKVEVLVLNVDPKMDVSILDPILNDPPVVFARTPRPVSAPKTTGGSFLRAQTCLKQTKHTQTSITMIH